jgi:hypothetical protein
MKFEPYSIKTFQLLDGRVAHFWALTGFVGKRRWPLVVGPLVKIPQIDLPPRAQKAQRKPVIAFLPAFGVLGGEISNGQRRTTNDGFPALL